MSDLLSAASLLLTVVGIFYGLWYVDISTAIDSGTKLPSHDHPEDRAAPIKRLHEILRSKAIPLSVASLCVALVFLPPSLKIVIAFSVDLVQVGPSLLRQYDAIATAFVVVELFSLGLACASTVRAFRLWQFAQS